jgi:hypothetical protein
VAGFGLDCLFFSPIHYRLCDNLEKNFSKIAEHFKRVYTMVHWLEKNIVTLFVPHTVVLVNRYLSHDSNSWSWTITGRSRSRSRGCHYKDLFVLVKQPINPRNPLKVQGGKEGKENIPLSGVKEITSHPSRFIHTCNTKSRFRLYSAYPSPPR